MIDPKLVEDFVCGDHEAFRKIFELSYARVCAFIRGFVKNRVDAEELTQIVFIKLWEKRASFSQVLHFDSYLFTLTKYTVFNYMAAKSTALSVCLDCVPETYSEFTSHEELVAKDLQLLIDMVVDGMPPQRKLIYQLSRVKGLSNEQIAEQLGLQKKTVENHLNLALKAIRNIISLLCLVFL